MLNNTDLTVGSAKHFLNLRAKRILVDSLVIQQEVRGIEIKAGHI